MAYILNLWYFVITQEEFLEFCEVFKTPNVGDSIKWEI